MRRNLKDDNLKTYSFDFIKINEIKKFEVLIPNQLKFIMQLGTRCF